MDFDTFNLIMFAIPGFFFVWSYTKAKGTKIESDFEYLAFSFFWGLIIFVLINTIQQFFVGDQLLLTKNPYASMIALSIGCIFLGNAVGGRLDVYVDRIFAVLGRVIKDK